MSAVIFALLLVTTALGLERYSTVHSLDDVQGRLEVEDHLVEAGEPAVIHLVVRNYTLSLHDALPIRKSVV